LQHALESYRVPKHLVGKPGAFGPIPARLNPVFRDREDLSSASDLGIQIKQELAQSETLIVICSPTAASSQWVNEEIRCFRQLPQGDRVFALIVEGDPQPTNPKEACFPAAMIKMPDGSATEPLAADARKYADGKRLALLKIVAGILGMRLDELRRRDAQRRIRNRLGFSLAGLVMAGAMGWLAYSEATTRATAQAQRVNTEELLGFMLGDLKRLAPIEGLETVPADDLMQKQFSEQYGFAQLDAPALMDAGMNWREEGVESKKQSDLSVSMELFKRSRAAFIELNQREGGNEDYLFELGQAEYYVGETHYSMGEVEQAEQAWARYGALTRRLVNAAPKNAGYVMELSYTLINLGALDMVRIRPNTTRLLQLMQAGVQYNQMALVLDPGNAVYRDALPNNLAWQADAWLEKCELDQALEIRQQAVELRRELLAEDPRSRRNNTELAMKLTGLASVQQMIGMNREASANFEEIDRILREAHLSEPNDSELEWEMYYRQARYAGHLLSTGDVDRAGEILDQISGRYDELSDPYLTSDYQRGFEAAGARLDRALVMLAKDQTLQGRELMQQVLLQLEGMVTARPGMRIGLKRLAMAVFESWQHSGLSGSDAIHPALDFFLSPTELMENCFDADLAARLAVVKGDIELAKRNTDYVLNKHYLDAGFINFCKQYQLCDLP